MTKPKGQRSKTKNTAKRGGKAARGRSTEVWDSSEGESDNALPVASGSKGFVPPTATKRRGSRMPKQELDHGSRIERLIEGLDMGKTKNDEAGSLIASMQVVGMALHNKSLKAYLMALDDLYAISHRFLAKVQTMVTESVEREVGGGPLQ